MKKPKLCLSGMLALAAALLVLTGGSTVAGAQAAVPGGNWGPPTVTQGFALQVEMPQPSTGAGASQPEAAQERQVVLRFALQNVTSEPLFVADAYPEADYHLALADASGNSIEPLGPPLPVSRCVILEMQPGEILTQDYDLTSVYGPLPDGEYSIVARRFVFALDGGGTDEVESNFIAISISRGRPSQIASRPGGGGAPGTTKGTGPQLARQPDLLAARPILERHGFSVTWDPANQTMTASKGKVVATIQAQKNVMMLGRQETRMTKPAKVVKGQLSAPGQAISMITSLGGGPAAG